MMRVHKKPKSWIPEEALAPFTDTLLEEVLKIQHLTPHDVRKIINLANAAFYNDKEDDQYLGQDLYAQLQEFSKTGKIEFHG